MRTTRKSTPVPDGQPKASVVRAWAQANRIPVGERGRVHPDVYAAYAKRNGDEETPSRPTNPEERVLPSGKRNKPWPCGFCSTGHHELCPDLKGGVRNADPMAPDRIWHCICFQADPELHLSKQSSEKAVA
jgi:hypothetical protein